MVNKSRRSSATSATAFLLLFAVGCVPTLNGNEPREVNKSIPASFGTAGAASGALTEAQGNAKSDANVAAQKQWREYFGSPELTALIGDALKNNRELNGQLQEIVIAQTEISAKQGDYLPRVNAFVGAGVDKPGKWTSQGVSDDAHGLPKNLGNFTFGLQGAWEIDIWKKLRNAANAANYRYLATIEARNFMITQLVAEIARSYYDLISLDNELDVVRRNIEVQSSALEVVKLEKQAARVTELAVQRFEAEVLKTRSRLYDVEQERVQTENRINFLVGRYPQPVARNAETFKAPLPSEIRAGLPSQLLTNRPDVRAAELELEATKMDVKATRAAFYPSLSLDASVGYRSFNAEHLLTTPESLIYNIAGNLTAPLLNRAAISAQYRTANAKQVQAVFNYEKSLLQAFTDVANQLAMIDNLKKSYDLQAQQVEKLARSIDISNTLFQSARADYMEVLLTRRDSLEAELSLIETKKRQFQAVVNVYQALGGGWK